MKRLITGLAFVITALSANATVIYTGSTTLTGAQEVPPTGSPATGTGMVTVDDRNDRDPNTNLLSWNVTFSDLTSTFTAAHFHGPAMPGHNAPVTVPITASLVGPPATSGTLTGSAEINSGDYRQLAAGLWYLNVHSTQFPAGEIRGQLPATTSGQVPEPSTLALLGLALVGLTRMRLKARTQGAA